jgi:hypothetical protein
MAFQGFSPKLQFRLSKALRDIYKEDEFDDLLNLLDRRFVDYAAESEKYSARMKSTLQYAYRGGWLIRLVELAREEAAGDLELQAVQVEIVANLKFVPPENLNHFKVCCLNGGHIMVDRDSLREALEKLYDPREKRIIVVNDEVPPMPPEQRIKTGKSHTRKLIAYLREVREDFGLVDVDLEEIRDVLPPPKLIMPNEVASSIVRQMKYKTALLPPPPKDSQWARWSFEFCEKLVAEAMEDDRTWWIVIDSFNIVLVPPETLGLINLLTQRISDKLGNVRMILVGYNGPLLPTVRAKVDPVKVFEQKHLIEFFTRAFTEKGRKFTEEDVVNAVIRVLDGADSAHPDFVAKVASLIIAELERP